MDPMANIFYAVLFFIAGAVLIGISIYNIVSAGTKKDWKETKAKFVGIHHYVKKNPPSRLHPERPAFSEGDEKEIEYTVDGKTYKGYLPVSYDGELDIYYNRKRPHKFKTEKEMKEHPSEFSIVICVLGILGLVTIVAGVFLILVI